MMVDITIKNKTVICMSCTNISLNSIHNYIQFVKMVATLHTTSVRRHGNCRTVCVCVCILSHQLAGFG